MTKGETYCITVSLSSFCMEVFFIVFIPDKPFKTYEEQLSILKSRNITIIDREYATMVLQTYSYYTLINGYKDTILQEGKTDYFIEGTTFEKLVAYHYVDSSINSILLKYILYIERSFKTKLAYYVAEKFGVDHHDGGYLQLKKYPSKNNQRSSVLNNIKSVVEEIDKYSDCPTKYYKNNKNHIPPWILVNDLMFGQVVKWYNILPGDGKTEICKSMFHIDTSANTEIENKTLFLDSINMLCKFRNAIAHGSRTFNSNITKKVPKKQLLNILPHNILDKKMYEDGVGSNDIYAVILCLSMYLDDPYQLIALFRELDYAIGTVSSGKDREFIITEVFKLPINFFEKAELLLTLRM